MEAQEGISDRPHSLLRERVFVPMSLRPEQPIVFAVIDHRRMRGRAFGILPPDLLRHAHILGKTGMGKSVLLEHLLVGLIQSDAGCGLIDPHGDLADRLLELVPKRRLNDVVLLDAADTERPIGWNPLDHQGRGERSLVASNVLGIFQKVFSEFWGPRLEHVFRNTLLALLDQPEATLLGVLRMLVEERFRAGVVARIRDPLVRFYWTKEFPAYAASFAAEVVAPVQNKVAAVLTSPVLRGILGQRRSTVTAREIMDHRRIFIANVSKGRIGEEASAMLGAVLTTSFQSAAYSRASLSIGERHPFILVIDEFASFVTQSFAQLLSEARKYGLGLVLAHQYLAQLDDDLRAALFGNTGTAIAFRMGADDSITLGKEFAPEVDAEALVRLDAYQIALRLAVHGISTRAFTATTLPPIENTTGGAQAAIIRRISAERYGTPRLIIERELREDLGLPQNEMGAKSSRRPQTRIAQPQLPLL